MNITFAVFQSDGTTVGSNNLLKLLSTGPALSCTISCTILWWRLSCPPNLILLYSFPTQMNAFLFQALIPSSYFAFASIFCSSILLKTGTNYLLSFWDLRREVSEFSKRCLIWNNFNNFLPVFSGQGPAEYFNSKHPNNNHHIVCICLHSSKLIRKSRLSECFLWSSAWEKKTKTLRFFSLKRL